MTENHIVMQENSKKDCNQLENEIEDYFIAQIKEIGGLTFKFTSPGNNGVPDRIVLYKDLIELVELKKPGGAIRKIQKAVFKRITRKTNSNVYLLDTKAKVDRYIRHLVVKYDIFDINLLYFE